MPYYDTIDEDLARAKQILAEGRAALDARLDQQAASQSVRRRMLAMQGGTIYGKDTFAAYKLLESFVAEIERLREVLHHEGIEHSEAQELVIALEAKLTALEAKLTGGS